MQSSLGNAQSLVAIAKAAHNSGDRALERRAIEILRADHGIRLSFDRRPTIAKQTSEVK